MHRLAIKDAIFGVWGVVVLNDQSMSETMSSEFSTVEAATYPYHALLHSSRGRICT